MFQNTLLLAAGFAVFLATLFHSSCSLKVHNLPDNMDVETIPYNCTHHSSCGNISNIKYPFRLKGDPPNCGDPNYELSCENNQTILSSNSEQYVVKAINYNSYTIRIADFGVHDGICSSRPINSFSDFYKNACGGGVDCSYPLYQFPIVYGLVYVSCETPMKSRNYVDLSPCIVETKSTNNRRYHYVLVGDVSYAELNDSCTIDFITVTSFDRKRNFSYMDIHEKLVYGIELPWIETGCSVCRGEGFCCFENDTVIHSCNGNKYCTNPSFHCGFHCVLFWVLRRAYWFVTTMRVPLIGISAFLVARLLFGFICLFTIVFCKWRKRHLSMDDSLEKFLQAQNNLMPIRYSYSDIKKMSRGFHEKLGEGGYGSVHKGKLRSGQLVAIKMLGKSNANGQDFINEVATIGRIHHFNVVRLVGFCAEGPKRALVYDFMPKGSLDKYIFAREGCTPLSWNKMYEISLGVARGIEYLHRGCSMQILHFDIKPHNILLDDKFVPKISDFGLAKLYPAGHSIVSITAARGTLGYIAPELIYKRIGSVSYKADVYSFGMLLLEMTGKRKKLNATTDDNSSNLYFPLWVYREIVEENVSEMEEEGNIAKKMIIVGLWCIQMRPANRPSMRKVIEMLEAETKNLELPPKPTFNIEEEVAADNEEATNQASSSSFTSIGISESVRLVPNTN
ncbi:rust resistance kinase Lr10-like isoform X2 [Tripterygium wilfordii]|uniref:rust resistance kinase Lr10-like isoform X2 n=1 Tax=Tripterygium wilfordii TaxID=458696 RepID=UPI0018F7EBCF|nr:rust resistance kinase Lr10-like isoform X2 [Tripterygium wilfordii]